MAKTETSKRAREEGERKQWLFLKFSGGGGLLGLVLAFRAFFSCVLLRPFVLIFGNLIAVTTKAVTKAASSNVW